MRWGIGRGPGPDRDPGLGRGTGAQSGTGPSQGPGPGRDQTRLGARPGQGLDPNENLAEGPGPECRSV